ncbi:hypothetical protein D9M70_553390 [compost metagenome]
MGDRQGLAVFAGFGEVLQRLFFSLSQGHDADAPQGLLAATRPGDHVGLCAGSGDADEQAGDSGMMDLVFLAGNGQAVQPARCQLLFHVVPMGALWVQRGLYGADLPDTTGL